MKPVLGAILAGTLIISGTFAETEIKDRKENQQSRIGEGVANGSLTANEASHLEKRETKLNKTIRADRKANGGHLTNNQKKHINQRQNNISKDIYNEKHDAQKQ